MTNRNAETLTHLYAARTALTAYRQSLDQANAATQPSAKLTALYTARAHHADYLAALKRGDYVYQDGKGRINTKLGFDFEKTVADSGADKWAVWQQVEPLTAKAYATIAASFQINFSIYASPWRSRLIIEINQILFPLIGSNPPDWSARELGDILAIRAELGECEGSQTYEACVAILDLDELQRSDIKTELRNRLTLNIRVYVGTTFGAELLTNFQLAEAELFLFRRGCAGNDLNCLTIALDNSQAHGLAAYSILNSALKREIIEKVNEIVGFDYDGLYGDEALPTLVGTTLTAWSDATVSARALYLNIPFRYNRFEAVLVTTQPSFEGEIGCFRQKPSIF